MWVTVTPVQTGPARPNLLTHIIQSLHQRRIHLTCISLKLGADCVLWRISRLCNNRLNSVRLDWQRARSENENLHPQSHKHNTCHDRAPNPPLECLSKFNPLFGEIRFFFSWYQEENYTYPRHTCPSPLIPAAKQPPCSVHYCRRQGGCCCCCCWGPLAARASYWVWSAVEMEEQRLSFGCLVYLFK